MTPATDKPVTARNLTTRVELVDKIRKLGQDVFNGAKYGWDNTVAQLKIVNSEVELTTEGTGMLRKVVDGQIIIPEKYKQMEIEEEGDELEEEDNAKDGHEEGFEEGHGESDVFSERDLIREVDILGKSGGWARRSVPSPRLGPPIASWALSQGTTMLEPVVRLLLVEQSLCS
ncbi:hypothetical protein A2U01_0013374 [Trifolium medium]|uniref:Uncharacterized protein n=1 Tax=Trifolium medium TaxID=97028 RepID=A0A392MZP1_9FABA|nr:hypothetical protein [Trifolium medium]